MKRLINPDHNPNGDRRQDPIYRDSPPPPNAACMQCSRYVICPPCDASPIMVWCRVWCGAVSVVQGECSAGVQASVVQNGAGQLWCRANSVQASMVQGGCGAGQLWCRANVVQASVVQGRCGAGRVWCGQMWCRADVVQGGCGAVWCRRGWCSVV